MASIKNLAQKAKDAAPELSTLTTDQKNSVLLEMADALRVSLPTILKENLKDLKAAQKKKLKDAFVDRLVLNEKRVEEMARGLEEVAALPDPVGKVLSNWSRPNGLEVQKVRIPLGVIGVIYESRPNVTIDAAGLCFKSGNVVILRGGSEAINSNKILGKILQDVLKRNSLPAAAVTLIPTTDRKAMVDLLKLSSLIDIIIPRGGEGLMKFVGEHSKIPVIKHDKGVCNIFVDESADIDMAIRIIENAKVQRPGVCNAAENVVIHQNIASQFLPRLKSVMDNDKVELRGDKEVKNIIPVKLAKESDWNTEYLELILSLKIVKDIDAAINFCRKYGSLHSEAIVTRNQTNAEKFVRSLDSSCILVNASTRFNDGNQLGLGAEIGISTTKLHAFGPMGLEELTSSKFVVYGQGQIRD